MGFRFQVQGCRASGLGLQGFGGLRFPDCGGHKGPMGHRFLGVTLEAAVLPTRPHWTAPT